MDNSDTLVIILGETRAHELTFSNFQKNVLERLNADLCICIGIKPDYDYNNPYYVTAKHRFLYEEPDDYASAFDYAYEEITQHRTTCYEPLQNMNFLYGKLSHPDMITDNITCYMGSSKHIDEEAFVVHTEQFEDDAWKNRIYGIQKCNVLDPAIPQMGVITYKKPLPWREFLKIPDQYLGGIQDTQHQHPGSAGILIFFRWFLLKNLVEHGLIHQYKRFVITRSDFVYQLPHPQLDCMNDNYIWIPDGEHYGGYTDRHVVLSPNHVEPYLNFLTKMVLQSNDYFRKMWGRHWNLEGIIQFHLEQQGVVSLVREFPYVMYAVRQEGGSTRWTNGTYYETLGYYIKYLSEYNRSSHYRDLYQQSGLMVDDFYKVHIPQE